MHGAVPPPPAPGTRRAVAEKRRMMPYVPAQRPPVRKGRRVYGPARGVSEPRGHPPSWVRSTLPRSGHVRKAKYGRTYKTGSLKGDVHMLAGRVRRGKPKGSGVKGMIGGAPSRPRRMKPIRKTAGKGGDGKAAVAAGIAGRFAHNTTVREAGW